MTTITVESEMNRRTNLINNPEFIANCIEVSKAMGITADQWNEFKAGILLILANEVCALENKNGGK